MGAIVMDNIDKTLQKKIDGLIKIGLSIENIYTNFCNLEKEGKRNSDEYKKYIDYLEMTLEIENKKLEYFAFDEERLLLTIDYLEQKYNLYGIDANYDYMYLNKESKAATRIITTFDSYLDDIYYNNNFNIADKIDFQQVVLLLKEKQTYDNLKTMGFQMQHLEKRNNLNKTNKGTTQLRDPFLDYKYNLAFVNKNLETDFLLNDFNVCKFLSFKNKEHAKFLGLSLKKYENLNVYVTSSEIINKVIEYCKFTEIELLLSHNKERNKLILWFLINNFNNLNSEELLTIREVLFHHLPNDNLNPKSKKIVLSCLNNSLKNIAISESKKIKKDQVSIKRKKNKK